MKQVDIQKEYPRILGLPLYKSLELLIFNISHSRQVFADSSGIVYNREDEIDLDPSSRQIKKLVADVSEKKYLDLVLQGFQRKIKKHLDHDDYNADITNYLVVRVVEAYVEKLGGKSWLPITREKIFKNEIIDMLRGGYVESEYNQYLDFKKEGCINIIFYDKPFRAILGDDYNNREVDQNREYLRFIDKYVKKTFKNKGKKMIVDLPN